MYVEPYKSCWTTVQTPGTLTSTWSLNTLIWVELGTLIELWRAVSLPPLPRPIRLSPASLDSISSSAETFTFISKPVYTSSKRILWVPALLLKSFLTRQYPCGTQPRPGDRGHWVLQLDPRLRSPDWRTRTRASWLPPKILCLCLTLRMTLALIMAAYFRKWRLGGEWRERLIGICSYHCDWIGILCATILVFYGVTDLLDCDCRLAELLETDL